MNRAKLDVDAGAADRARAEYDALLAENPDDTSARLGRALLALRHGRAEAAEADLTALLGRPDVPDPEDTATRAELLAHRALARLILGRPAEAERDAAEAFRLAPGPARERLRARALRGGGPDRSGPARPPRRGGAVAGARPRARRRPPRRRPTGSGPRRRARADGAPRLARSAP